MGLQSAGLLLGTQAGVALARSLGGLLPEWAGLSLECTSEDLEPSLMAISCFIAKTEVCRPSSGGTGGHVSH